MKTLTHLEPMLCRLVAELPEGPEWSYEVKWDGYRAIGEKSPAHLKLRSRNDKSLARSLPAIVEALAELRCTTAIVDGEIVALNEEGRPDFQLLQAHRSKGLELRFMLFDLLELDGDDMTEYPLEVRRATLKKILPRHPDVLGFSQELHGSASALMSQAQVAGIEGLRDSKRNPKYCSNCAKQGALTSLQIGRMPQQNLARILHFILHQNLASFNLRTLHLRWIVISTTPGCIQLRLAQLSSLCMGFFLTVTVVGVTRSSFSLGRRCSTAIPISKTHLFTWADIRPNCSHPITQYPTVQKNFLMR